MLVKPLSRFVTLTFLLLPVMFTAWFFMGNFIAYAQSAMTYTLLNAIDPGVFAKFKVTGAIVEVGTKIPVSAMGGSYSNAAGYIAFDVRPMLYGYGMPLFLALFFAAPLRWGKQAWKLLGALLVLLAAQCWGVSFEIYKALSFNFSAQVASYIDLSVFGRTFVAYSYQLGSLMLPVIVPVALWFAVFRQHWRKLVDPVADPAPAKPHNSFARK